MGNYLNPGNSGFATIRNSTYVDKTGMIYLINKTIDATEKLTCISRPRRFGKSFAAKMLCAYYDRSCDSSALFDDLEIAADQNYADSYHEYLNQYDVIYLDMTAIIGETSFEDLVPYNEAPRGRALKHLTRLRHIRALTLQILAFRLAPLGRESGVSEL